MAKARAAEAAAMMKEHVYELPPQPNRNSTDAPASHVEPTQQDRSWLDKLEAQAEEEGSEREVAAAQQEDVEMRQLQEKRELHERHMAQLREQLQKEDANFEHFRKHQLGEKVEGPAPACRVWCQQQFEKYPRAVEQTCSNLSKKCAAARTLLSISPHADRRGRSFSHAAPSDAV